MKLLRICIILIGWLLTMISIAETPIKMKMVTNRAMIEYKLEILERASINRELATISQIEYINKLELKVKKLSNGEYTDNLNSVKLLYKEIGSIEFKISELYGLVSINMDKAVVSRLTALSICETLKKSEQQKINKSMAINLKIQSNESIKLASTACEKSAISYNIAEEFILAALSNQQAAIWLEKLSKR